MGLLPIEWAISIDFTSAGMLAAKAGVSGGAQRAHPTHGGKHPWAENISVPFPPTRLGEEAK